MSDVIYTFQGKDITMNVCIQIRAVVDILQETENALWAESAEYIADRYFAEMA